MDKIPKEILWEIMLFVPRKHLVNVLLVRKSWEVVQQNDVFWKEYLLQTANVGMKEKEKGKSWKKMYQLSLNSGVRIVKKKKKNDQQIEFGDGVAEKSLLSFQLLFFSRSSFGLCDTFIYRYVHSKYINSSRGIGPSFHEVQIEDIFRKKHKKYGNIFNVNMWNFRTQVRHEALSPMMFKHKNGFVMAVDLGVADDLKKLKATYKYIIGMSRFFKERKQFSVLVGLKYSKKTRVEIDSGEIITFCEDHDGLKYFEVSLEEGINVTNSVSYLIRKILDNLYKQSEKDLDSEQLKFNAPGNYGDFFPSKNEDFLLKDQIKTDPHKKKRCSVQ